MKAKTVKKAFIKLMKASGKTEDEAEELFNEMCKMDVSELNKMKQTFENKKEEKKCQK